MKTKLTLTVQQHIIEKAKRKAKQRDVSLSQLFEDIFDQDDLELKESQDILSAKKLHVLLSNSENSEDAKSVKDKERYRAYLKEKYA